MALEIVKQNYTDLKTYSEKIIPILDDYKKAYIFYNTVPDNQEYASNFAITSGNVTSLNKDLFVKTNDIQKSVDDINKQLELLNTEIQKEKEKNGELKYMLQDLEGKGFGSKVMNSNSKELYKKQYISNWDMIIGIGIVGGLLITLFRKPSGNSVTPHSSSSSSTVKR
jgi:hypothetical protein